MTSLFTFKYEKPVPKPTRAGSSFAFACRTASRMAPTMASADCCGTAAGPGGGGPEGTALCEWVADMMMLATGQFSSPAIRFDAVDQTSSLKAGLVRTD